MRVLEINGPVVRVENTEGLFMHEVIYVGKMRLTGEVIALDEKTAIVQVYEETSMLEPGELVERTGKMLSVALGPGSLETYTMEYSDR